MTTEKEERDWVVERTWLVKGRTATEAMEASKDKMPDAIRVYEGPPRPVELTDFEVID